jgi:hypothetical protein
VNFASGIVWAEVSPDTLDSDVRVRGRVASEPDLVRLTKDYLLVDTASRPGTAGSPVILRSWGNHLVRAHRSLLRPAAHQRPFRCADRYGVARATSATRTDHYSLVLRDAVEGRRNPRHGFWRVWWVAVAWLGGGSGLVLEKLGDDVELGA